MPKLSMLVMFAVIAGGDAACQSGANDRSAHADPSEAAENDSGADSTNAPGWGTDAGRRSDEGGTGVLATDASAIASGSETGDAAVTHSGAGTTHDAASRAGALPSLQIYSDTASIEFTPALLAAQSVYPGEAAVHTGGIANLFNAGQADLATNAETQALRQSAQRPNLRIICTVTETFYRIVARRSAGIAQLLDLRGKRVGTVPNTSAHYYLDKMLRTVGLSADDVTVVAAFPLNRMPAMLMSGQVDAVTSWEPEPQNAVDALQEDAIELQDRSVYREIVNLHTTAENLSDPEKRRGIVAFVRALIEAAKRFQSRPEEAWALVAEATGYEPALIAKVWHLERFPGTLVDDLLDVLEEEEPWVARQTDRTARSREELATLIDRSVLDEALMASP